MTTPLNDEPVDALKNIHAIARGPGVQIPDHIMTAVQQYTTVVENLSQEKGRAPSTEEIANELGLTVEQVEAYEYLR